MLVTQKRPRELKWFLAGPLLYGDWGTSRLYVLGLAFYFTGHASPLYLAAMGVLMAAVAWAYTVICRCFPDGGGVYTAARQIHPVLSVVGATLLLAGYVITAAISLVEAFHHFRIPLGEGGLGLFVLCAAALAVLGFVNWFGAKAAGRFALVIAGVAMGVSLVIAVACVPALDDGLKAMTWHTHRSPWGSWTSFVAIVLALSGVESVANMTGLMKEPVGRTAKKTIWPVLAEVAILNLVFGVALTALPELIHVTEPWAVASQGDLTDNLVPYRDTAMHVLAVSFIGPGFGAVAGVVFGLLLVSAANTAVVAQVSVLYAMAHDKELPKPLSRLNYSGVPWPALIASCVVPAVVLAVERDVTRLAELYAVGVCGAIAVNVFCCAANRKLPIKAWERACMALVGAVMAAVFVTIIGTKWNATLFAGAMVFVVLAVRQGLIWRRTKVAAALSEPTMGWMAELERPPLEMKAGMPRIMLAARGRYQAEFAVDLARRRGGALFAIYVRTLGMLDVAPGSVPSVADDPEAAESLGTAALLARQYGVPFVPIYVVGGNIVEEILDYTVTFGCDTLILGKSRRRAFAKAFEGDVVSRLAAHLPSEVALITREATPHPMPAPPTPTPSPQASREDVPSVSPVDEPAAQARADAEST